MIGAADRIAANLRDVRRRIEAAGGDPDRIAIVAVTKTQPVEVCRAAVEAGLTVLGENRVQEALDKMDQVAGAEWHMIGHLQTNKARHAARFSLVQSVGSDRLAEAIGRRAPGVPVLLEVNASREPEKTGVLPEEALAAAERVAEHVELRGVMGMGPRQGDPRPAFAELRRLRGEMEQRLARALPVLSMGMSGDFEIAVQEGSTMLRLGTVLVGSRTVD